MKSIKLSNGLEITAHVGDGFDGSSGVFVNQIDRSKPSLKGKWGWVIPHKDLPKVIRLLKWYEKAEMKLRNWEGKLWRQLFDDDYPALESEGNPYDITFRRGHLESHLKERHGSSSIQKGCGCKPRT